MGKRIIVLWIASFLALHANAKEALFDFRQLDGDSANYSFINRFSDSRMFNCYGNGKLRFSFGVGEPVKGSYRDGGKTIEADHLQKYRVPLDWTKAVAYISIQAGVNTKSGFKEIYDSIGKPLFDDNDSSKYMVVELVNGKKIELTRFGPIPEFPFNTKKKLKPFFHYLAEGEPRYECGATNQPD